MSRSSLMAPVDVASWLRVFIVTAEAPDKCAPALAQMWPDLVPGVGVTVLSGGALVNADDLTHRFPGLCVEYHSGESVWHLRQRIGKLVAGSKWLVLLEDHNVPLAGWLPGLLSQVRATDDGVHVIFGATCNQTSTEVWDWANYLAVQAFHWAPLVSLDVHPLPFNVAVRVACLPVTPWAVGTLEQSLPRLTGQAVMSSDFVVDHIQRRTFPSVLGYHFANGRATGATARIHLRLPALWLASHLLYSLVVRPWRSLQVIRRHPQRLMLPPHTGWRLLLLLGMHACGAVVGFVAGPGQSMWQLE